jgi:hypothetical protein
MRNGRGREIGVWELISAIIVITVTVIVGLLTVGAIIAFFDFVQH